MMVSIEVEILFRYKKIARLWSGKLTTFAI